MNLDREETTLLPRNIEPKEVLYRDSIQTIQRVVAHFDGFSKEYFVSDHGRRAAVVAVRNGDILLVRQYRLLINRLSYEVPGGRIDGRETPEAAATRECLEETGVRCNNLKALIDYLPSLDVWKNPTYVFYSEEIEETGKGPERVAWTPLEHCIEMIFSGQVADSLSIIAVLAYAARRKEWQRR